MKFPCVCATGMHSLTARELVTVVQAFQRGELHTIAYDRTSRVAGVVPRCVMDALPGPSSREVQPCNVVLSNGTVCKKLYGHLDSRHGTILG